MRLLQAKHKFSKKALDSECNCFVCRDYTRAHLRHLLMQEEGVGFRLASYHNLYFFISKELLTTETELNAIATAAIIGLSRNPENG